jgi:hypothetical protein
MDYASIDEIVRDLRLHPVEATAPLYHPIPFPEFAPLATSTDPEEVLKKLRHIRAVISTMHSADGKALSVLDIGANAGFYTFSLARDGLSILAVEPHPRYAKIGRFLAADKRLPVQWVDRPFDCELIRGRRFDVALMLSVFQWMASAGEDLDAAAGRLRCVSQSCEYLFFELGFNSGVSCLRTRRLNHYAKLVGMLRQYTVYRHFKLLGRTALWGRGKRYLVLCSNDPAAEDSIPRKLLRSLAV